MKMTINYVVLHQREIFLDGGYWDLNDSNDVKELLEVKLLAHIDTTLVSSWEAYVYNPYYVLTIL